MCPRPRAHPCQPFSARLCLEGLSCWPEPPPELRGGHRVCLGGCSTLSPSTTGQYKIRAVPFPVYHPPGAEDVQENRSPGRSPYPARASTSPGSREAAPASAIGIPGLLSCLVQGLRGPQSGLFILCCVGTQEGYGTSVQFRKKISFSLSK